MTKTFKPLATKIISHVANKSVEGETYNFAIPQLGYNLNFEATEQKDADAQAVKYIEQELKDGNLTLADTWAEDNIKG